MSGSLLVVGTGIGAARMTHEARSAIRAADDVLYLVPDPVSEDAIRALKPTARSLADCYGNGRPRSEAYALMTTRILAPVRAGRRVCAAFYGHPGVFVLPSHDAIARARAEGFEALMCPGVSAEDCLFADLGVDPADDGCQSYEASRFVARRPAIERSAALLLWQVGAVDLSPLVARLLELYPPEHEVVVYEAASYPGVEPLIRRLALSTLAAPDVTALATLFVPPLARP